MTFLEQLLDRLQLAASNPVVCEIHGGQIVSVTGGELLAMVQQARTFLASQVLKKGDRCALLAPNSIRWIAMDIALMAEGLIVVPLNTRQTPSELVAMMKDCTPVQICCANSGLVSEIQKLWPAVPPVAFFDSVFSGDATPSAPLHHNNSDAVTIIYTSGTSGEPKGVVLNAANVTFMLGCTNQRLDLVMGSPPEPDRVFQYAPFCFAAAWILLLTSLSRNSILTLSTDLTKLSDELKLAAPNYFVNVPMFLERVRAKIEDSIRKRGGLASLVFTRAHRAYLESHSGGRRRLLDSLCLALANTVMFPSIRKSIGRNLKALICGSAPLAVETQLFFMMLGVPVLQVYGLTETTAICTMDDPRRVAPGHVGPAVPGIEMTVSDTGEILVRGPNIFPGYWQRPADTANALEGGWFHSGDRGEADKDGNWRITGRLKNLIVLNSGHNIAPEPLEQELAARLPEAWQIVLVGNQRSFLVALVTVVSANGSYYSQIQSALDALNTDSPHYKQIRAFQVISEPFTPENGLLTAMGKIKREAIAARFAAEIEQMYRKNSA
ncbi:MAG: AMP-dependent synthetase/ligase [Candidatus Acidiferrales bacterium]